MTAPHRHLTHSRWLKRTALCLTLGAVITVAEAWFDPFTRLEYWTPVGLLVGSTIDARVSVEEVDGIFWAEEVTEFLHSTSIHHWPHGSKEQAEKALEDDHLFVRVTQASSAKYSIKPPPEGLAPYAQSSSQGLREFSYYRMRFLEGWPWRSLEHTHIVKQNFANQTPRVRERFHEIRIGNLTLPAKPIWTGFTLNTIFYAAICLVPIMTFAGLKRRRRKGNNCCLACGYSLQGITTSTCPECGRTN